MALYPWQETVWCQLMTQRATLPHALLLSGERGIGKRQFAEHLAQYLLCEADKSLQGACGHCTACHWFSEGTHPDFCTLTLDEESQDDGANTAGQKRSVQWITVDSIRMLNDFIGVGSHRGGWRIVLVYPAEAMNLAGANAFLKMLEEPPARVIFILVSHRWQRLLATIKSRCRRFALPMPDKAQALSWLILQKVKYPQLHLSHSGGAPLLACELANQERSTYLNVMLGYLAEPKNWNVEELVAEIEKFKVSTSDIVDCWQKWVLDSLLYQEMGTVRYYPERQGDLPIHGRFGAGLWKFYDLLIHAQRYASHPLNQRLVLEKIFYHWLEVLREARQNKPIEY